MEADVLENWAQRFFTERVNLVKRVLPFDPSIEVTLNGSGNRVAATIVGDLSYAGPAVESAAGEECRKSDLYSIKIEYLAGLDRTSSHPAIHESSFQLLAARKPAIRFEYEREKKHVPAAHVHVHGVGGLLSPGLMRNGKKGVRTGDWQSLHIPVGGHRFRLSMEEFLYFVINECGFRPNVGWEQSLQTSRVEWLDTQCRAAVRDSPQVAAEALRLLGYTVTSPDQETDSPGRHLGW